MKEKHHILVTGATGFIGKHLVHFLSQQENIVVCGISKNGGTLEGSVIEKLNLVSLEESLAWFDSKPSFGTIFHLAALNPDSFASADADRYFFPNMIMTSNVLSLASVNKSWVIYASSGSIYGAEANIPFREDTIPRPSNWYSLAKYAGELACDIAGQRHEVGATSLRISAPFGPGHKGHSVVNTFLQAALEGRELTLYGTGARTQDFIYIADVVQAMWLAYQRRSPGVYNIASGHPVSMRELAQEIVSLVSRTRSQLIYTGATDPQERYRGVFSIDKAERDLGFVAQTSLSVGLRSCLDDLSGTR